MTIAVDWDVKPQTKQVMLTMRLKCRIWYCISSHITFIAQVPLGNNALVLFTAARLGQVSHIPSFFITSAKMRGQTTHNLCKSISMYKLELRQKIDSLDAC